MKKLSIFIPTYNRNEALNQLLEKAVEYRDDDSEIVVVDNYSDRPVSESVQKSGVKGNEGIRIIRNQINIGMAANFIECFRQCETEWMWLLSDDDVILPNAFNDIEEELKNVGDDCIYINFSSSLFQRTKTFSATGCSELINKLDSFKNLLFISTGLYRVKHFLPQIRFGYQYAYSMAPHVALLLTSIGTRKVIFSSRKIVDQGHGGGWSIINFQLVKSSLLELPVDWDETTFLKFAQILSNDSSDDEIYFYQLLSGANMVPSVTESYLFKSILQRNGFKRLTWRIRLKRAFLLVFMRFPKMIRWYIKCRKNFIASQPALSMKRHSRI